MKKLLLFLALLLTAGTGFASEELGIYDSTLVEKTFWRYDFRYATTDGDNKPIVLSAAIFMHKDLQSKKTDGKGCILLNHFTITDKRRPPYKHTPAHQAGGCPAKHQVFHHRV